VCRRHDVFLIEDNPYGMFGYDGVKMPTLKALDRSGTVLYIGSFSKTLFPALRLGYLVADQQTGTSGRTLAAELSRVKSVLTVNTSPITQAMAAGVLLRAGGSLARLVDEKRRQLRHRRDVLLQCLGDVFGDSGPVTWNRPEGGYFVAVSLPFESGADELQACAAHYGVLVCPMRFFTLGETRECQIRLSFSALDDDSIREGIERLAQFVDARLRVAVNDPGRNWLEPGRLAE
jgi:(S)-3,5-dihydroxyphenylglycine transaminase